MSRQPSSRDLTKLSAYLDGELNASARQKLEERLARDPNLAVALDDLRLSRTVLRRTPKRRAPRSFTLSPQMVAKRPPMPRLVPALNYASLAAVLLFVFSLFGPIGFGGMGAAAPEPMMEMEEMAPAEEPAMELAAAPPTVADSAMEEAPAEEPVAPVAEAPLAEEEMPAAEEPANDEGANLGEAERSVTPTEEVEEGIQAEKTFVATAIPTPTTAPTPVAPPPPVEATPIPLLTPYQRILVILLGIFVILSWALRRATVSKWQKTTK